MDKLIDQYRTGTEQWLAPLAPRDAALDAVRRFIASGGYRPGDRLPPERELTSRLGLTRTHLRKALDQLARDGVIWRHVGKGTFVSSDEPGGTLRPQLAELSRTVSPLQMMRARLALEPSVAREAAINTSDRSVDRIVAARDAAADAESWDGYEAADDAMHRAIAEATENALLLSLFDQLNQVRRAVAWDTVIRRSERPPRDHTSFKEHERIVAAIVARNAADADAAMRDHLRSVSSRLFGEM